MRCPCCEFTFPISQSWKWSNHQMWVDTLFKKGCQESNTLYGFSCRWKTRLSWCNHILLQKFQIKVKGGEYNQLKKGKDPKGSVDQCTLIERFSYYVPLKALIVINPKHRKKWENTFNNNNRKKSTLQGLPLLQPNHSILFFIPSHVNLPNLILRWGMCLNLLRIVACHCLKNGVKFPRPDI